MNRDLVVFEPFRSFRNFDRAFDRFFGNDEAPSAWYPAVDIKESDASLRLRADLPGVDPKDVHIEVKDNVLSLRGERKNEAESKGEDFHRVERSFGYFARSFALPRTVDSEKVEASYRNGVLEITLQKKEEAKPRQIEVKIA